MMSMYGMMPVLVQVEMDQEEVMITGVPRVVLALLILSHGSSRIMLIQ